MLEAMLGVYCEGLVGRPRVVLLTAAQIRTQVGYFHNPQLTRNSAHSFHQRFSFPMDFDALECTLPQGTGVDPSRDFLSDAMCDIIEMIHPTYVQYIIHSHLC